MKPSPLTYHRPRSIDEACEILAGVAHEGKVLAGGQSLIPLLSMRLAAPAHLVDIGSIPRLDAISASPELGVTFDALTTHTALESDSTVAQVQPLLGRALRLVAHPTIRNRGTTVGSIVHADPSAEMPAVLSLLGERSPFAPSAESGRSPPPSCSPGRSNRPSRPTRSPPA